MCTLVVLCGIVIVIVIMEVGYKRENPDHDIKKGCMRWFLALSLCFLLFVGYAIFSMYRFVKSDTTWHTHTSLSAEDKVRWSYYMLLPEAEPCFEYYSLKGIRDPGYMVETYAYSSAEELCSHLPEGCEKGITAALSTTPQETEDIRGEDVKQYKVYASQLPLIDEDEVTAKYGYNPAAIPQEYYINEYADGTLRFVGYFHTA